MDIKINNFGKIKEANISLSGLSLIAGPNDSGKSTVGKCLFAIIKAVANYPEYYNQIKTNRLYQEYIYPLRIEAHGNNSNFLKTLLGRYAKSKDENISNVYTASLFSEELREASVDKKIEYLRNILRTSENEESITSKIKNVIEKAIIFLDKNNSQDEQIEMICNNIFKEVFSGNLINSVHKDDVSSIEYSNAQTVLSVSIKNNNVNVKSFNPEIPSLRDATFIDNPLLLEKENDRYNRFMWSYALNSINDIEINIPNDIMAKKNRAIRLIDRESYYEELFEDFNDVFQKAEFMYDTRETRLKYRVSSEARALEISNIASGSKAFGLLYVLLKSGVILKDSLLILDEPENHLHPEWQLKYAQIICKMVKNGFHVLMTSHSPYMIQAIKTFSEKEGILDNKVNFYFAQQDTNYNYNRIINIRDENGNLNDNIIFDGLYAPIEKLDIINERLAKEMEQKYLEE